MDIIPNLRIANCGDIYKEAAQVLEREKLLWPAAINAALAIEIYLKSFLAKDTWKECPSGGKYKIADLADRGHNLVDLYKKISPEFQEMLKEKVFVESKRDLVQLLEKYKEVFTDARYPYEESAQMSVGSDVIRLSEAIWSAIESILRETDSVLKSE